MDGFNVNEPGKLITEDKMKVRDCLKSVENCIKFFLFTFFCILAYTQLSMADASAISINNETVKIEFVQETGCFDIIDNTTGEVIVDDAFFQAGGLLSKDPHEKITVMITDLQNEFGEGQALHARIHFDNYADIYWKAVLYDQQDFVEFSVGIINDTDRLYLLKQYFPMISPNTYPGKETNNSFKLLDGNSGGNNTHVRDATNYLSFNNLMFQFGQGDSVSICVAGGLSYHEFEKFVEVKRNIGNRIIPDKIAVKLFAEDPVGKNINPHSEYMPDERFYFCFNNNNPFEALEKYGLALKKAQEVELDYYDFPTECLWYASVYSKNKNRPKFNDSRGAVDEMKFAIQSGITKYTRVGIRLVPDAYGLNNQQGWWDDEHWAMYGQKSSTVGNNYTEPYLTTKSWCGELTAMGGIPFIYFQGSRRSEDFVKQHPEYMLFNDPYRLMPEYPDRLLKYVDLSNDAGLNYTYHWWQGWPFCSNPMFSYDYTDPGFLKHMNKVYNNLKEAGLKGIMYDYPEMTSWAYEGGFEDKYTTTARAYRKMYEVAKEGLGPICYLNERNLARGSDITLGLVASQRVWGDTDQFLPEMITRTGLRWYKNRVVVNYDTDAKDPLDALPVENLEGIKTMMTMCYVLSGRFLQGRSFEQLSEEQIHVISRTFPYHSIPKSARPIDAFTTSYPVPRIFDFEVNPEWHQLTFYNDKLDSLVELNVVPAGSLNNGGLGMEGCTDYYVYDFWNDSFVGKLNGQDTLKQILRAGETRMMSLHAVKENPQFLSTNRHIMQGMIDLRDCRWDDKAKVLNGESDVVGGDDYIIVIAKNGFIPSEVEVSVGEAELVDLDKNLMKLVIRSSQNRSINWRVQF